jgi:tRNA threonylcarbamoyladenosine biosynthesis protein TsaB
MVHVLLLAADTSSSSGSLAVLRENVILGLVHSVSDEPYSSRLFRHLDFLLRDLSLGLKDFDAFAVASGPGSFTGLRVGLSAAKAWSESYGRPVSGISTLQAVAVQSRSGDRGVIPILDAHRQQLYYGLYHNSAAGLVLEGEEQVVSPEGFLKDLSLLPADLTVVGTDQGLLRKVLATIETGRVEIVSPILAPWIGRLALAEALLGKLSDSLTLDANYVRRSDAELLKRGT